MGFTGWSMECRRRQGVLYASITPVGSADHSDVQTHLDQLEHVKKGCLARPRDDIRSDGSRIEGSHKGWNGLQRSHASGIETLTALSYDFVLRRNLRVELSGTGANPSPFALSTYGSHHVHLVNACAKLWNKLLAPTDNKLPPSGLQPLPELVPVNSGETFGLVKAGSAVMSYHNLVPIKEEPLDDLVDLSAQDPDCAANLCNELGIDPSLMLVPQQRRTPVEAAHAIRSPSSSTSALRVASGSTPRDAGKAYKPQTGLPRTAAPAMSGTASPASLTVPPAGTIPTDTVGARTTTDTKTSTTGTMPGTISDTTNTVLGAVPHGVTASDVPPASESSSTKHNISTTPNAITHTANAASEPSYAASSAEHTGGLDTVTNVLNASAAASIIDVDACSSVELVLQSEAAAGNAHVSSLCIH